MTLSSVIQIAQNSLSNLTRRTSVLARNVNEVGNDQYSRRDLQTLALAPGSASADIRRTTDLRLEKALISATSSNAGQGLYSRQMDALSQLLATPDSELNVSVQMTRLQTSLQTFSATPASELLANQTVSYARELATGLNEATSTLQRFRSEVDRAIGETVDELNQLLSAFRIENDIVRQGSVSGTDINDALDQRGALLAKISAILPVSSYARANNEMVLVTTSGATLLETSPRIVTFEQKSALSPATDGNAVFVDLVRLNFSGTAEPASNGTLGALLHLRDTVAPGMQTQLDEIARALIGNFAESTTASGLHSPLQGLFTWAGGPAFPSAGTAVDGLAGTIAVNPAFVRESGGNPFLLRDGGSNGTAYSSNPAGSVSFSERLIALAGGFDAVQPFDVSAGLGAQSSLGEYVARAGGWLAGARSQAQLSSVNAEARRALMSESLSNVRGVNIDLEMAKLGELEQGYQASARLLRAADEMLQELLSAVG